MASLYKRKRSPFWWIKCRDAKPESPTFGKIKPFSTGMKVGVGLDTRRAREMCAECTLAETKFSSHSPDQFWNTWVPNYLKVHCEQPTTLIRYQTAWRMLSLYLAEKQIDLPRQVTRARCFDYMEWRAHPDPKAGKYKAGHNTAHTELKIFSLIMREAVVRGFAPFNPVLDLGINRKRVRVKPEYSDEHLAVIRGAIAKESEADRLFLSNSFEIARYQGCRLNETYLNPMTDVDIFDETRGLICFRLKGGKEHTAPLHPKLIPLFQNLKLAKKTETYPKPKYPSNKWRDFLRRHGIKKMLPGACFHSFRVTVITRLARKPGISESKAMAFIGHASTTVHRTYQRLRAEDLSDCMKALD